MTFQKYFGKKAKFLIATLAAPIIAIFISGLCQPKYFVQYTCTPQFEAVYTIILVFIIFSVLVWVGVGLFHLIKFIRSRRI